MVLIAQHIHTLVLLPVHLTHEGLRVFKGISPQIDTSHTSPILAIAWTYYSLLWRSWTAFHFPLPDEAEMVSQPNCDRVHTDKGFQEAVFVNAWVELNLQAVHN